MPLVLVGAGLKDRGPSSPLTQKVRFNIYWITLTVAGTHYCTTFTRTGSLTTETRLPTQHSSRTSGGKSKKVYTSKTLKKPDRILGPVVPIQCEERTSDLMKDSSHSSGACSEHIAEQESVEFALQRQFGSRMRSFAI